MLMSKISRAPKGGVYLLLLVYFVVFGFTFVVEAERLYKVKRRYPL